ncbi:hypothetical protein [Pseudomonas triticicola]|uniref:hypothetical protein n=1 Tax=Pseudomonas triticicola TaxID=2842345 RepID=UPI003EB70738
MSSAKINTKAFTANLYLDGRPVVLNEQRLKEILLAPRITQNEKLDAEVGLADLRVASHITLAEHEDHPPLLLHFTPHGEKYAISMAHSGAFDGARLFIEDITHKLLASTSAPVQYFTMSTFGVNKASLSHVEAGPVYVGLNSEPNYKGIYRDTSGGISTFMNVDPNDTGHNAFNNKYARFVIRVIKPSPAAV